jgi:hypothetical protein
MPKIPRTRNSFLFHIARNTLLLFVFLFTSTNAFSVSSNGLGQCHWLGPPFNSNQGVGWGYSGSIEFDLVKGDGWAAVEKSQGVYTFTQQREEVDLAKSRNKKMWLDFQVASVNNKEHNVPKWALDAGVEAGSYSNCGDFTVTYDWSKVAPFWNDPNIIDQSEAVKSADGKLVTFPRSIAAVWDPKFRLYYLQAVKALRDEFKADIQKGTIEAFNLHSGGNFGEHYLSAKCEIWSTGCVPDIINPSCPVIQSMAKIKNKTPQYIASRSNCDPQNTIPGNDPIVCTGNNCPVDSENKSGACYVFDDYFIQAMKELIRGEVEIFNSGGVTLPIVWQDGSGLSHSGRTGEYLKKWINSTYGSRVWIKWNGWGPKDPKNNSYGFNNFGNSTKHGYEPEDPANFSRTKFKGGQAQTWCAAMKTNKPPECDESPLDGEKIGKIALAQAIKRGMVDDKSSYLCLQGTFFEPTPMDRGGGKMGNEYFFNPNDNTQNCNASEINVATYGVGFCPGYLNYVFSQAGNLAPSPTLPASSPTKTITPGSGITATPTATPNPAISYTPTPTNAPFSCKQCANSITPHNSGNANCDGNINDKDYLIWKNAVVKTANNQYISEEEQMSADFNCQTVDGKHAIDLSDFEIWRRNALK